jgi:hypothetical protein
METSWTSTERRLWDAVMTTPKLDPRLSLRGLPEGKARTKMRLAILEQRTRDDKAAWRAYELWVRH